MRPRLLSLIAAAALPLCLGACATTPTPSQEAMTASGLRIATVAYVTRAQTQAAQAQRAAQIVDVAALVRAYVHENGDVVVSLDAAAAVANDRIAHSDLAPSDKALAQAIVIEALLLAGDQQAVPHPALGAENAARLLALLGEIERSARVFGPPA